MLLQTIWFILIFVLLGGYAILDGFDFGVGILHLLSRGENERRISINSIAPVWDGNEVWLLTGGGALFAAFPPVYAAVFSGFYLALMLLLMALIFRAVSMEFRGKVDSPAWRSFWDIAFVVGSFLPPVLLGVALGNVVHGVPLNEKGDFTGTFLSLLNPYSVLIGVFTVLLFTLHGGIYLCNKTSGEYRRRIVRVVKRLWPAVLILPAVAGAATWYVAPERMSFVTERPAVFGMIALPLAASLLAIGMILFSPVPSYRMAFCASSLAVGLLVAASAVTLFPILLPAKPGAANSLTIYNSSSSQLTLQTMFIIALVGMPLVIGYTAVIYRCFKGHVVLAEESY
ncbi:MAG TPA: cytochrome d ubiquinol oxidase subunit II [Tepidisphaeraceae bacterium]|nr:cytochrome d ubiquinol oxidase subunit II [Tepidisphaeraceae bacterium]